MEIEFQGQYNKKSFYRAVVLAGKPTGRDRVLRTVFSLILVVLTMAVIVNILIDGAQQTSLLRTLRILLSLFTASCVLLVPYFRLWRTAAQLWRDPSIQVLQSGAVTSSGIVYRSSRSQKEYKWQQYSRRQIEPEMIVLLTTDGILTVLPRVFFKSDADWERVTQLVDFNVVEPK